jgi:hypothetical protein
VRAAEQRRAWAGWPSLVGPPVLPTQAGRTTDLAPPATPVTGSRDEQRGQAEGWGRRH